MQKKSGNYQHNSVTIILLDCCQINPHVDRHRLVFINKHDTTFWGQESPIHHLSLLFVINILGQTIVILMQHLLEPPSPTIKVFILCPEIDSRVFAKGEPPSDRWDSEKVSSVSFPGVEIKWKTRKGLMQLFCYLLMMPCSLKLEPSLLFSAPVCKY